MDEAVKAELARLRDEDNRQNHRIDDLEQSVKAIQDLTISVHAPVSYTHLTLPTKLEV